MDDKNHTEDDFIEGLPPHARERARQIKLEERLKTASSQDERDEIADDLAASSGRERMRDANLTQPLYTVIAMASMLMYLLGFIMLLAVPFYEPATLLHATCLFVVGFCLNALSESRDDMVRFTATSESFLAINRILRGIKKDLAECKKAKSTPTNER